MSQQRVQQESLLFAPTTLLSLYILDGSTIGIPEPLYLSDYTNTNGQAVIFDGITYMPFPIKVEQYEQDGKGSLPRPKVSVSNINGFISNLLLQYSNLIGAKFIRRRVYARFIDAANFPNNVNPYGSADPTAAYPDDPFYIYRKISETPQMVQFELSSLLELEGVKVPHRQILALICPFKYRDPLTCKYSGPPVADMSNKPFGAGGYNFTLNSRGQWDSSATYNIGDYVYIYSTLPAFTNIPIYYVCNTNGTTGLNNGPLTNPLLWIQDSCPRSIAACKLRFPAPLALRGGFFPGVASANFRTFAT